MRRIIIGVIGTDAHVIGSKILEHALRDAGYDVVHLGTMVSQAEFISAAIETKADLIMVSSLYGHAELDCEGMKEKCNEAGLRIPLWLGGNLTVGRREWAEVEAQFCALGFDRVFPPGVSPFDVVADVRAFFSNTSANG